MDSFIAFYKDVVGKKLFFIPVLFFLLIGYCFSINNRTISIDDLTFDSNTIEEWLGGRWGMYVWAELVGFTDLYPFVFRFLAVFFFFIAALQFCYLIYSIDKKNNVLPYTIFVSTFVAYPLIHEIFEYEVSYMVTGNLCFVTMAAIVMRTHLTIKKKVLWASLLITLPISSYESAIFYYITLVSIIILYEQITENQLKLSLVDWIRRNLMFFIPVAIALVLRVVVQMFISLSFGIEYTGDGANAIMWLEDSFLHVMKCMMAFAIVDYFLCALIYFPITIFVLSLGSFVFSLFMIKDKRQCIWGLGLVVVVSLFVQTILQGYSQPGRTSQAFSLFVAFSSYLLVISVKKNWRKYIYVLLFALCWHQAVYLNKLLGLNNLRSDNELAIIRQIGSRLLADFDKKPIVFVGNLHVSEWIMRQISVDESTWNGCLFYFLYDRYISELKRPYKYIGTNVNVASGERYQLKAMFSYCGYDLLIFPDYSKVKGTIDRERVNKIQTEAERIVYMKELKPSQIFDNGDYLIVNLGM